ncbi:Uncharacterized protein APZ42_025031 [Daphnia magna]|uniref:Uncharacterized protein n=1 Tax=Daphnia magna TaxID=35525 RepID=A0A164TIZ9_9CRUS|nr:Uncharacterized protein APZ42_025031 [Daphnia magna]
MGNNLGGNCSKREGALVKGGKSPHAHPRMRKCITYVRKIIEQEGNKNCDANAKSSLLLSQLLNFSKEKSRLRYNQWTIR